MKSLKKILKTNFIIVVAFVLGIISSIGVAYAAGIVSGSSVSYTDNQSLGSTNVQDALDKLVVKTKTNCPEGYECTAK